MARSAETAGVVKADAYGLGAAGVAAALWQAGCRSFFVAWPSEALALRAEHAQARIFVLAGLDRQSAKPLRHDGIVPVLNSTDDIAVWKDEARLAGSALPCALHFDTGMNRLGLAPAVAAALCTSDDGLDVQLVMSHLACGDEPTHEMNARQLAAFQPIAASFSGVAKSLANSGGIFCGPDYHFDLTRPGIALYGGEPVSGQPNPMHAVVSFEARILQIRHAKKGETVGYSASHTLTRDSAIAVAGAGYADGIARGASGRPDGSANGWLCGHEVPVLGRISMDLTAFDVTDVPEQALNDAMWVEFFGRNIALDDFARACGTISYEVLTGVGRRAERVWV